MSDARGTDGAELFDPQTDQAIRELAEEVSAFDTVFAAAPVIDRVAQAARAGRLTVILGAGASQAINLPLWDTLVDQLYEDVYAHVAGGAGAGASRLRALGYANTTLVRHLESLLGFPGVLRRSLVRKLYQGVDEAGAAALLRPLCDDLLDGAGPAAVRSVITYNFDNMLERQLRRSDPCRAVRVVFSGPTCGTSAAPLTVYHPHGYLPHPEDDPDAEASREPVVFSERDYHAHYMAPGHWANVLQLHHFTHATCLFIGVSLTDPNVRRLLDHARATVNGAPRHVATRKTTGDPRTDYFVSRDLRSMGVEPLWVRDHPEIPALFVRLAGR